MTAGVDVDEENSEATNTKIHTNTNVAVNWYTKFNKNKSIIRRWKQSSWSKGDTYASLTTMIWSFLDRSLKKNPGFLMPSTSLQNVYIDLVSIPPPLISIRFILCELFPSDVESNILLSVKPGNNSRWVVKWVYVRWLCFKRGEQTLRRRVAGLLTAGVQL